MGHNTTVLAPILLSSATCHHSEHNLLPTFNGLFRRRLFLHHVDGVFNAGGVTGFTPISTIHPVVVPDYI